MEVDLERARLIGRHLLDATMPSPIDWSCAWSYDELPDCWVLFVEYIGSVPPGPVPPGGDAPIVVAKADGSVSRTVPDGPVLASNRFLGEQFHRQLGLWLSTRYDARQLQAIAGMRHLRFYVPDGRDWRLDSLRFAVRIPVGSNAAEVRHRLGVSDDRRVGWPPVNASLDGHPVGVEEESDHLIVDIAPVGEDSRLASNDLAFAAELDARLGGSGLEVDTQYAMWSWRGMIDPAEFPEVFAPRHGPL